MKKVICSVFALALVGATYAEVSAEGSEASPTDGIYRVTEIASPTTAHSCNFGGNGETFFPDKEIINNGDGTYTQDYLFPGTNVSICDQPGSTCANTECSIDGKFSDCGSDQLVVNFGFLGFDATVTFGADRNNGNNTHTFWPTNNTHMSKEANWIDCEGADCALLGTLFFGPEFSFPCGDVATITRYDLEE
jgi:hypothetical protein